MEILGINHIGIASRDPLQTKNFFESMLGLKFLGSELVTTQNTNTMMFQSGSAAQCSNSLLEILENQEGQAGPIKAFLEKKGPGIHHLALTVSNIKQAIEELKAKGVELIDSTPKPGVLNTKVIFIHPRSTGGILIELVEEPKAD